MKQIKREKRYEKELGRLRKKIDQADRLLFRALALRTQAVRKIGMLKRTHGISILQSARWKDVLRERVTLAQKLGIGESFSRRLLALIHRESLDIQIRMQGRRKKS